jgi:hypothetical protein
VNRIATVGLFTALNELVKADNMPAIKNIVDAVLDEAQLAKKDKPKEG